jgi:hypothetical protein
MQKKRVFAYFSCFRLIDRALVVCGPLSEHNGPLSYIFNADVSIFKCSTRFTVIRHNLPFFCSPLLAKSVHDSTWRSAHNAIIKKVKFFLNQYQMTPAPGQSSHLTKRLSQAGSKRPMLNYGRGDEVMQLVLNGSLYNFHTYHSAAALFFRFVFTLLICIKCKTQFMHFDILIGKHKFCNLRNIRAKK